LTAKDAEEGLRIAVDGKPDLILLDFILPDMKGDAVCSRLVANEATAEIPVVMMSSNVGDIRRAESEYRNVVKAIAKPFTPDLLTATVRFVIRSRETHPMEVNSAQPVRVPVPRSAPSAAPVRPATIGGAPVAVAPGVAEPVTPPRDLLFMGKSDLFPLVTAFQAI
jgi:DNA-binding response OmpR family regulator